MTKSEYFQVKNFIFILLFLVTSLTVCCAEAEQKSYQRIVSMLPSITEILFALDVGDQVVGVTRYCDYPPEARKKAKVGGILDTNYEVLFHMNPDLVLVGATNSDQKQRVEDMGIEVVELETKSIEGVLDSIRILGAMLNRQKQAASIAAMIEEKIKEIQSKTKDLPKPRVLITFLRSFGEGIIRDVYVAGNDTYFNDVMEVVGSVNAYEGPDFITSPVVSAEGIFRMNPDVIIELLTTLKDTKYSKEDVLRDWNMLSGLKAYQSKKIHIFSEKYLGIPGPRLVQTLETVVRVIHPDIDWD